MTKIFFPLLLAFSVNTVFANDSHPLISAIKGDHRTEKNRARDAYRHPLQTLAFFDVREDMTVVEIWPGGGWYTEILAPYLQKKGKLYAAHFDADSSVPYYRKSLAKFKAKTEALPSVYAKMEVTELSPPDKLEIAPANSVDRVLTFRNVHNWMKYGQVEAVFAAMHKALKPGGVLGIVEHRSSNTVPQDPKAKSGYVREDYVIQLAENAGFKLLAKSEINANNKDETVHPAGVWSLPPSLRLKQKNVEKFLSIGESDRMTLKFVKP